MFASLPGRARRIAEQEAQLASHDETAEHARWMHELLEEIKEVLDASDPKVKFEPVMLDPTVEAVVRYEPGRSRYAIYTTDTAGTAVIAQWAGKQWKITTTGPGWVSLDYPPGTLLYSGDANRHFIIARLSNLKV